jgi:predicted metal-dependent peptidase
LDKTGERVMATTAADKIVRQNVRMAIGGEPFFGSLALRLCWVADESCPTMATDGRSVYYNPKFVEGMTADEVKAVAIHEIMHVALLHPLRVGDRDRMRANIAMDYAINLLIRDCGYQLPSGALIDEKYRDMSWEQIYNLLPETKGSGGGGNGNPQQASGPQQGGGQGNQPSNSGGKYDTGDVLAPGGTVEEMKRLEEDIKVAASQAESHAKVAGKMPAPLRDLLAAAREPEEDYRHLFEKFISPIYPRDYTWQRPARRFMGQGMYLPSVLKDGVGTLAVGIDTSGSISSDVMENFLGMINHFLVRVRPEAVHVLYCDATVYKHDTLKPGRPMELDGLQVQSGGTRFSPVFDFVRENELRPKAIVYLTDMICHDFGPDPGIPTIWMQYGDYNNNNVPFGQVVKIKTV